MRKRILPISIIIFFLIVVIVVFFWFRNSTPEAFTRGEAVAVATTPVQVYDGLWNSNRIFDELYFPVGIALDGSNVIVADSMADRIQVLDNRENQRIGRPGRYGFSYFESGAFVDGFHENAMFMKPFGVSVSRDGNLIVSDTGNNAIRLINNEFVITIAGNGNSGFRDGNESEALFNQPRAAVMCPNGYIYVADTMNHVIRRISPSGDVSLFAGTPNVHGFIDGTLLEARFFEPSGLYISTNEMNDFVIYIADSANHAIRRIENGQVTTVAGQRGEPIRFTNYFAGGHVDGSNDIAMFDSPRDIALLPDGSILVADSLNHAIRKVTPTHTITLVGGGSAGRFHESTENLRLTRPEGIATDGETLFISDTMNNRVVSMPLTERVLGGRPPRNQMLAETGLTLNSRFAFRGDIRIFMGSQRVDIGRVAPWIRNESIFVPVRPLLEFVGADVHLNEQTGELSIIIDDTVTTLMRDIDYFILRGVMVTTLDEIIRLFPYTIEWFPELSLIVLYIPVDLRG